MREKLRPSRLVVLSVDGMRPDLLLVHFVHYDQLAHQSGPALHSVSC